MEVLYHLQNLWMAAALGLVLLVLSTQWDSTTHEEPTFLRRGLRLVAWMFICIGGAAWWVGVSGVVAIVLVFVILMIVFGFAMQRYRVMENRALVSVVLAGMEKGISPITSVVAYRQEAVGLQEAKAGRFARALGAGMTLGDAARTVQVQIPAETLMTLELGRTLGNVDEVNRQAKQFASDDTTNYGNFDLFLGTLVTIVILGGFQLALLIFLQTKIMPSMVQIVQEFDMADAELANLWAWGDWTVWAIYVGLGIVMPLAIIIAILMITVQFGHLSELPRGLRWVHGPVNECRLLNILSVVIATDLPLQDSLDVIRRQFPSSRIRHIANALYGQLKQGGDWIDALGSLRVVSHSEAALARSAQNVGNLAWALREISVGKRRRHLQRMAPTTKIALPILVLLAAIPVLVTGLVLIIPLTKMVTLLSFA